MTIGHIEVTLREAIFSVTIASGLFAIGFLASSHIEHSVNQRNLEYRQAAQIDGNTNEFALAMRTDIGNAFVSGEFRALDPVAHDKLKGKWAFIRADYQKYTMHTRTVHYTTRTANGQVCHHTRTEHYWTWDTYDVKTTHARRVNYCGVDFDFNKFIISHGCYAYKTVDDGFHRRIKFDLVPSQFAATAYTRLADGTVANGTMLHKDETIAGLYKSCTDSCAVVVFWVFWSLLMIVAVIGFIAIDNHWLEK